MHLQVKFSKNLKNPGICARMKCKNFFVGTNSSDEQNKKKNSRIDMTCTEISFFLKFCVRYSKESRYF